MKRIGIYAVSACCLALAGCGGDGGGGTASIPPPPASLTAKAAVNANPFQPTANESFVNDAVTGTITGTTDGGVTSGSVGTANLTISYDATAKTYALSAGGNSKTISPTDLQPQIPANSLPWTTSILFYAGSLPGGNVYGSGTSNGSSVEQVVLASGTQPNVLSPTAQAAARASNTFPVPDLKLSYVSFGQWTKATTSGTSVSGSQTLFVYGAYTTDSQLPRSGSAEYGVNIDGTYVTDGAKLLSSFGVLDANFATGKISITSNFNQELFYSAPSNIKPFFAPAGAFSASATMSSTVNSFSGTFNYAGSVPVTGTINGKFYGPAAQEVGATFSGSNANAAILGTIVGSRGSTPIK